ncbi:hypothetical protein GCM10010302_06200 [Streptomyces polychromogenes]|uniref:Uncharacterized protein n=1 Tax=Streptomyces polychromogenes TaxID=67342 RepID=A0ABN0V211_9ACTN
MGIYLCSVDADAWSDDDVLGPAARLLDGELVRRGLPRCTPPPAAGLGQGSGSGTWFEEKMYRPMRTFEELCRAQPDGDECCEALLGWDLLIPVDFIGAITLPVSGPYSDTTTVHSAHRVLGAARGLASRLALPPQVPSRCDNLDLGNWFGGPAAAEAAAAHPGPWTQDLDAAYYTALYLRAAEHSLRRQCPMNYV